MKFCQRRRAVQTVRYETQGDAAGCATHHALARRIGFVGTNHKHSSRKAVKEAKPINARRGTGTATARPFRNPHCMCGGALAHSSFHYRSDMPPRQPWRTTSGLHDRQIPPYNALFDPSCDVMKTPKKHALLLDPLMMSDSRRTGAGLGQSRSQQALPSWAPLELPSLETATLSAIDERETRLSHLHELLAQGVKDVPSDDPAKLAAAIAKLRGDLAEEMYQLRMAGVEVVEAVVRWRRRRRRRLEPFIWQSHNYLLKMLLDVFFLGLTETVAEAAHDPFLLGSFETPAPPGSRAGTSSKSVVGISRGSTASGSQHTERTSTSIADDEGGDAEGGAAVSRRRQLALASVFDPSRRHTKHELVRMWAAERILEAERIEVGSAFAPVAPSLRPIDLDIRQHAAMLFFGLGEPPGLYRYAPTLPRVAAASVVGGKPTLMWVKPQHDPASKPPPPTRPSRSQGGVQASGAHTPLKNPMGPIAPLSPPVNEAKARRQMRGGQQLPGLSPAPFVPVVDPGVSRMPGVRKPPARA